MAKPRIYKQSVAPTQTLLKSRRAKQSSFCREEERLLTTLPDEGGLETWVIELEEHIKKYGGMNNYPDGECFGTRAGTSQNRDNYICGDLDGNGFLNVLDIVRLAQCILGDYCHGYGCIADLNGDWNGDPDAGGFNVLDIVTLANCVLADNQNCGSCCSGVPPIPQNVIAHPCFECHIHHGISDNFTVQWDPVGRDGHVTYNVYVLDVPCTDCSCIADDMAFATICPDNAVECDDSEKIEATGISADEIDDYIGNVFDGVKCYRVTSVDSETGIESDYSVAAYVSQCTDTSEANPNCQACCRGSNMCTHELAYDCMFNDGNPGTPYGEDSDCFPSSGGCAYDCVDCECPDGEDIDDCGVCDGICFGDPNNPPMSGTCYSCDCVSGEFDCAGVCNGTLELDDCGDCDGGNADMDCAGECGGSAVEDECGECGGDGSSCAVVPGCMDMDACNYNEYATEDDGNCLQDDCAYVCGGDSYEDICGVCGQGDEYWFCGGEGPDVQWPDATSCDCGCDGWAWDLCGNCGGECNPPDCGNAGNGWGCDDCDECLDGVLVCPGGDCDDCAGVPNGDSWESDCGCVAYVDGVTEGDYCDDCAGTPNGDVEEDDCGTCGGDITDCNAQCPWTGITGDYYDDGTGTSSSRTQCFLGDCDPGGWITGNNYCQDVCGNDTEYGSCNTSGGSACVFCPDGTVLDTCCECDCNNGCDAPGCPSNRGGGRTNTAPARKMRAGVMSEGRGSKVRRGRQIYTQGVTPTQTLLKRWRSQQYVKPFDLYENTQIQCVSWEQIDSHIKKGTNCSIKDTSGDITPYYEWCECNGQCACGGGSPGPYIVSYDCVNNYCARNVMGGGNQGQFSLLSSCLNSGCEDGGGDDSTPQNVIAHPCFECHEHHGISDNFTVQWNPVSRDGHVTYNVYVLNVNATNATCSEGDMVLLQSGITTDEIDDYIGTSFDGVKCYRVTSVAEDGTESDYSVAAYVSQCPDTTNPNCQACCRGANACWHELAYDCANNLGNPGTPQGEDSDCFPWSDGCADVCVTCDDQDCNGCTGNGVTDPCDEEVNDECGVCGGDGSDDLGCGCFEPGPSGCDNACGSTLENDECGVCGGDGSSCDPICVLADITKCICIWSASLANCIEGPCSSYCNGMYCEDFCNYQDYSMCETACFWCDSTAYGECGSCQDLENAGYWPGC